MSATTTSPTYGVLTAMEGRLNQLEDLAEETYELAHEAAVKSAANAIDAEHRDAALHKKLDQILGYLLPLREEFDEHKKMTDERFLELRKQRH